ncbi:hypothetical protein ACO0QE_001295 [Hanseniaspora vineae]
MSDTEVKPEIQSAEQPVTGNPSEDVVIEDTAEKSPEQKDAGSGDKEEQERLKKLEEARKKVEALRNRKKNKKSKKKDTAASAGETSTEGTPVPDSKQSETPRSTEKVAAESEADLKPAKEEGKGEEESEKEKVLEETSEANEPQQDGKALKENQEPVHDELDDLFGKVESQTGASSSVGRAEATESFLATIQKEQESFELEQYKGKVSDLEQQVKKLKFDNMEYETTIDDLQDEVSELKAQLAKTQQELQELKSKETVSAKPPLSTASSTLQLSSFSTVQQQAKSYQPSSPYTPQPYGNLPQQENTTPVQPVDQDLLYAKWKDWNVDMTSWRSIGTGPIVQF